MAGKIFINYRREESGHVAGRLHDSLAPTFGRNKLFMDVDNIPVGRDFEDYLKSQVAACDAMLAIIGPNWLTAKDETGRRRLDNPDDFIAIEIGAALARDIPVVPVLVDGALMPKASELPDSLKLLARRHAVQVRHTNFNSDAEALVKRLREALGYDSPEQRWRVRATKAIAAIAVLFLVGWAGYELILYMKTGIEEAFRDVRQQAERDKKAAVEGAVKAEQERQARAAAEAEAKRKVEQAEQQRPGDLDRAIAIFTDTIRLDPKNAIAFFRRGDVYTKKGDLDRAITDYNEAIRLDPKNALAFFGRGVAYARKGDLDRAISDYSEVIRLDPKNALAFANRGADYFKKGDFNRAITDSSEAIRLDPERFAWTYCNRGNAKLRLNDSSGTVDIAKARQLDPSSCR